MVAVVHITNILGIHPRESYYSDVVTLFGEPEDMEIIPVRYSIATEGLAGGHRILQYPSLGIFIHTHEESAYVNPMANPLISTIYIEAPFSYQLDNGLTIGMSKEKVKEICFRDYILDDSCSSEKFLLFSNEHALELSLWFNIHDKLFRISI